MIDSEVVPNVKINLSSNSNGTESSEVIHLLNVEGSLLNIAKEPVHSNTTHVKRTVPPPNRTKNGKLLVNLEEYFRTVLVYKCIKCSYLCEEKSDILKHITDQHLTTVEKVFTNWLCILIGLIKVQL